MDTSAFASSAFDPVEWVNSAVAAGAALGDPLPLHLSMVTSQLEVAYDAVSQATDESAARALSAVPRAVRELEGLRKAASALQALVRDVVEQMDSLGGLTGDTVSSLRNLDGAKERLASAAHALAQVQSLSASLSDMDALFDARKFVEIAAKLDAMSGAVSLLEYLPSARETHTQILAYRERLRVEALPELAAAAAGSDSARVGDLATVLLRVDAEGPMWAAYRSARTKALDAEWAGAPDARVGEWLAEFMGRVPEWVRGEVVFAASAFAGVEGRKGEAAVARVVDVALGAARDPPFEDRMARIVAAKDSVQGYAAYAGVMAGLAATLAVLGETGGLVSWDEGVRSMIPGLSLVVGAFVRPVAPFLDALVPLTVSLLEASISNLIQENMPSSQAGSDPTPGSFTFELDAALAGSSASSLVAGVMQELEVAGLAVFDELATVVEAELVEVHVALIGEPVVEILTDTLTSFVNKMGELLRLLRSISPLARAATDDQARAAGLEWEFFQASIRGIESVSRLQGRLAQFDRDVRAVLAEILGSVVTPERMAWWDRVVSGMDRWNARTGGVDPLALGAVADAYAQFAELAPGSSGSSMDASRPLSQLGQFVVLASRANGALLQRVLHLMQALGSPSALKPMTLLPNPQRAFEGLSQDMVRLAFDFAFHRISTTFADIPTWASWGDGAPASQAKPNGFASLAPSPYITMVGDHLYMLLQQLEPFSTNAELQTNASALLGHLAGHTEAAAAAAAAAATAADADSDGDDDDSDVFTQLWVSAVAHHTMDAFARAILAIPAVSATGAAQLNTDIVYLNNVVSVLGESVHPVLNDIHTILRGDDDSVGLTSQMQSTIRTTLRASMASTASTAS